MDRWRIKAAMGLVCILTVSAFALTGCAQTEKSDDHNQDYAQDNNVNTPLQGILIQKSGSGGEQGLRRMEVVIFRGGQMGSNPGYIEQCRRGISK